MEELAKEIIGLARDHILIALRFLDVALSNLSWKAVGQVGFIATDGVAVSYDSQYILQQYKEEPQRIPRTLLHLLFHCIFYHPYQYAKVEQDLWDLATDLAVENVIVELKLSFVTLDTDLELQNKLRIWSEDVGSLTAERIYKYLKKNPISEKEKENLQRLVFKDDHRLWLQTSEVMLREDQWKKISERIKTDLKSFTKNQNHTESLEKNLVEATKDRYDYSAILQRFTVMGEDIMVNEDEFDYVYYTYGLEHYGNMPLIEPLEYRETKKVKEFVIAIDTSASCRGEIVKQFIQKTYSILKNTENFFHKINIHIIQCDHEIQSDTKITSEDDFKQFMEYGKIIGFGATDFRPIFEYVNQLKEEGEFENLRGLIYFTDGYGIYPEQMPDYDVIFAFLEEDENRAPVPPWSLKVIIEENEENV